MREDQDMREDEEEQGRYTTGRSRRTAQSPWVLLLLPWVHRYPASHQRQHDRYHTAAAQCPSSSALGSSSPVRAGWRVFCRPAPPSPVTIRQF